MTNSHLKKISESTSTAPRPSAMTMATMRLRPVRSLMRSFASSN